MVEMTAETPEGRVAAAAQTLGLAIRRSDPLAAYSIFGVGGAADLLVAAQSRADLLTAIHLAQSEGIPWRVFGGLTNLLLPDAGFRGLVILNRAAGSRWEPDGRLWVESGAAVVPIVREALRRGWAGLTWAVGLPGTIGGAVVNNAGAFGGEVAGVLVEAEILTPAGELLTVEPGWFKFGYRCSKLKGTEPCGVVLSATFQLQPGDQEHLAEKAAEYTERRRRTQPAGRTLGSTFKNPPGDYAGRLIEAAGLKGARVGGIEVSPQHANFFINDGHGTAADFLSLVQRVQETVEQRFEIRLEPEVEILASPAVAVH